MSNYPQYPATSSPEDEDYAFNQVYAPQTMQQPYQQVASPLLQNIIPPIPQYQHFSEHVGDSHEYGDYSRHYQYPMPQQQSWVQPTVPTNHTRQQFQASFSHPTNGTVYTDNTFMEGQFERATGYLSPREEQKSRLSRSLSFASNASSAQSASRSDFSRSTSPSANEMGKWGFQNEDGSWSCSYPGCSSRSTFSRGCDLRKHYKRHSKTLFCRYDGCPQATQGGFSSKKDRARHEAKHDPKVVCEWDGCGRVFSRHDNMKDHVRRVHKRRDG